MAKIDDLRIEETSTKAAAPGRSWRGVALVLLAVMLLVAGGIIWRRPSASDESQASRAGQARAATESSERSNLAVPPAASSFTAGGYVEIIPPGPAAVTARVEGWVRSVEVVAGQSVQAGQALMTLDDAIHRQAATEAQAEVALAEARLHLLSAGYRAEEIAGTQAQYRQAMSRLEYAQSQVQRYEQLVEIGAAPSRQLLEARAEAVSAEAELAGIKAQLDLHLAGQRPEEIAVARAELAHARTRLERLHWQVEHCTIRAPRDGVVLEWFARVGDWIAPNQGGPMGNGIVATIFDPQELQVWVEINQRDAGRVSAGQPVTLRADSLRERMIHGRVARIMPKANLQRNTVEVKIALTDEEGTPATPEGLRPEMSIQVTFMQPQLQTHQQGAQQ